MCRILVVLCSAFVSTAAFGQQLVYTWTNNAAGDLATAANWTPNGVPIPGGSSSYIGDEMRFDGQSTGPVFATSNTGNQTGSSVGGTTAGLYIHLTANQVSPVSIYTTVANNFSSGVRFNSMTNDVGSGTFNLGNTSNTNALDTLWGTTNPENHYLVNNSANPSVIYPNVRWRMGAGGAHTFYFGGTGNWHVTNDLLNANNAATIIAKQDSGTLVWTAGKNTYSAGSGSIGTPFNINGGTVVLKSAGLFNVTINNNGTLLKYDAVAQSHTFSGPINGTGALEVGNGTLTLSGAGTYSGNTTLSGGTLILGSAHNPGVNGPIGVGGTVFFTGGTLQFSVNNTFDYSTRFSSGPNQIYRFDTAGQNVTFSNALTSSGGTLTKLGSGTLTLAGTNTYDGITTVSAGKLLIQGPAGSGDIVVANSSTLGVSGGGAQITPAILTVGTSSSATLEFNNLDSTTTPIIAAGTISAGGPIIVNIASGTFSTIGQSYPLISWSSGSAPPVTLGSVVGAGGNLSTNGNMIQFNVTSLAFVWTGLMDGNWDTTTGNNWKLNGVATLFQNGGTALFDDTVLQTTNVTLNSPVSPASTTVNNATKPYSITSSGANLIGGTGSLTKNGNSSLTLAGGVNTYSGATIINGGVVSVGALANGGAASDIGASGNSAANLVFNGGTLQYTGGAQNSDRLFTLGTAGGTIEDLGSGALVFNNTGGIALSGSGARTLTLSGSDVDENTLSSSLGDNGGATALTKTGSGKWVVTGNNTNSGTVTITAGTLQVGAGGATGSIGTGNIANNGTLIFNTSSTRTNGTITGTGSVDLEGSGTIVLPGNNTYSGGTIINNGTLKVGNGGATGSLSSGNGIVNNGTLIFDTTGLFTYQGNGLISGTGNVIMRGNGGLVKIIGANSYTGWTLIEPGATLQPTEGNTGGLLSSVVTNNGTLKFVNQVDSTFTYGGSIVGTGIVLKDGNNGFSYDIPLTGTNTYTGGTFIAHGGFILGDGSTPGAGAIAGDVVFTNSAVAETARTLTFNRPDDFTFSGLITYSASLPFGNRGIVRQNGNGTVTLTANNDYPGGTVINAGALQVGDGGATGAIGAGPITDNSLLIFNRSGSLTVDGAINGGGSIVKTGSGTVTLNALNLYSGSTTVSNGTLIINSNNASSSTMVYGGTLGGVGAFFAPVTLETGTTLAPGASGSSIGTFTFNSDLTIGGNVAVKVNKSLAQSNDLVSVSGTLSKTGSGTLTVANLGPDLVVGDKFFLFNQALPNGNALTVTGAGATWQNDLATDGSITALTVTPQVNTNAPVVQVSVSGTSLSLAWPTNRGWTLQTNSVALTAANQWFSYPGSETITNVNFIINPAKTNVFFRMVYTNTP